jgi:hypothetical protein
MKRVLAVAGLALLPSLAHAQNLTPNNSYWMPPPEYDKPFTAGPVIVVRGDEKLMSQLCPKTSFPVTLGCRVFLSNVPNSCFIVIAKDDILKTYGGWTYEMVHRHEIAHCSNWSANHPGARSIDGRTKPAT